MIEAAKRSFYFFIKSLPNLRRDNMYRKAPVSVRLSFEISRERVRSCGERLAFRGHVLSLLKLTLSGVSPIMFNPQESPRSPPDLAKSETRNGFILHPLEEKTTTWAYTLYSSELPGIACYISISGKLRKKKSSLSEGTVIPNKVGLVGKWRDSHGRRN